MKSLLLFFLIVLYKSSSIEAVKEGLAGDSSLISELAQDNPDDMGIEDEPETVQTGETDDSPRSYSYKTSGPPQHSGSFKRAGSAERAEEKGNKLNNNLQLPVSDEDIEIGEHSIAIAKRTPVGRVRKVQKYKSLRIRNRNLYFLGELTFTGEYVRNYEYEVIDDSQYYKPLGKVHLCS